MQSAQVNQAYDQQYVMSNLEYAAYQNWQAGVELLESSTTSLQDAFAAQHDMDKQLDQAYENLNFSTNAAEFSANKDEYDRVEALHAEFMAGLQSL